MNLRTKRVAGFLALGLGTAVTLGAIASSDQQRLDSARGAYQKSMESAREVYEKRTAQAQDKLFKTYNPVIARYESRNDTEAVENLRAELEEILAASGLEDAESLASSAGKPLGHKALIEAIGKKVVDANGQPHDTSGIGKKQYMLLYFSAQWCPPCRAFTPDLVSFYNQKRTATNFDLVFVSSDRSSGDMLKYMKGYSMPWAAVPFNRIQASGLKDTYGGSGIPHLVVVDADGEVVSSSYVKGKYVGPRKVLSDLDQLLASAR